MTDVEIVNAALGRLGQSPITAFGENPGTGIISKQNYEIDRDSLLRTIPWNFARRWVTLSMLSVAPLDLSIGPNSAAPGQIVFTAAFQLPNDCLRVYRFSPIEAHWRVVGRQIYTDAVPATNLGVLLGLQPIGSDGPDNQPPTPNSMPAQTLGIEYVTKDLNAAEYDPKFTETLIWKLAKDLAFGVNGLLETYRLASKEYEECLRDAGYVNGSENWPDEFYNTQLTDVRYGYSNVGSFNAG